MSRASKERLTITVDGETLKKAKEKARMKGIPISRLVENFLSFFINPRIYCFECGESFTAGEAKLCSKCEWLVCPKCNSCRCDFAEETIKAIYQMRRTYEELIAGRVSES